MGQLDLFTRLPPRLVSGCPANAIVMSHVDNPSASRFGPAPLCHWHCIPSDWVLFDVGTPNGAAFTPPRYHSLVHLQGAAPIIYIFRTIRGSLIAWPSKLVPSVPFFFSIMGACPGPSPPLTQPRPGMCD